LFKKQRFSSQRQIDSLRPPLARTQRVPGSDVYRDARSGLGNPSGSPLFFAERIKSFHLLERLRPITISFAATESSNQRTRAVKTARP
jgi:hypothetical protein